MQYKLRTIVSSSSTSKSAKKVVGLTIPEDVAMFFEGCYFQIEKSGACIVAYSGASIYPTKEEINDFDINSLRV